MSLGFLITGGTVKKVWCRVVGQSFLILTAIVMSMLLAATYSRGGAVATVFALLAVFARHRKRIVLVVSVIVICCLVLAPQGGQRLGSIAHPFKDASISHRLYLWYGATGLLYSSPWVGTDNAGEVYRAWWQPLDYQDSYRTMINDSLTLGVRFGCWALFAYLSAVLLVCDIGWRTLPSDGILAGVLWGGWGAVIAYAVSGCFSTMFETPLLSGYAVIAGLAVVSWGMREAVRQGGRAAAMWLCRPMAVALATTFLLLVAGYFAITRHSYRILEESKHSIRVEPCGTAKLSLVVFFPEAPSWALPRRSEVIRQLVRPLLDAGIRVWAVRASVGYDGISQVRQCLSELCQDQQPYNVLALGGVAHVVSLAVLEDKRIPRRMILCNLPDDCPLPGMEVRERLCEFQGQLLLLAEEEKRETMESIRLQRNQNGLETRVGILSPEGERQQWLLAQTIPFLSADIEESRQSN